MGNYTRDTFDKLKHYVGVRLQQGVPIIDADWNEMEDIRKHELRTFLKWFLGNGVPDGSDGFHILPASDGAENDFTITGGTQDNPGRCLVDGWDVIIKENTRYTQQTLYNNDTLAQEWHVDPLGPLSPPSSGNRTDTVYLDIWEREVDALEDNNLVNPAIGIETCVRLKREWVVRVAPGKTAQQLPAPPTGHVYYPLAALKRAAGKPVIGAGDITDLRRTGLAVLSEAISIKDGNVGIGTQNPGATLDVSGNIFAGNSDIYFTKTDHNHTGIGNKAGFAAIENAVNYDALMILGRTTSTNPLKRVVKLWDYLQVNGNMDVTGNVGIGTQNPAAKLDVNGDVVVNSPDNTNIFGLELKRTDEDKRIHSWKFWHMNKGYGKNSLQLWEYKTDSTGKSCDGNAADGAMCNPRVTVTEGGKVGIGTSTPGATLDVSGNIFAGNSDIYFTKTDHNHTGIGNKAGYAAIENAKDYDALMILGRTTSTNPLKRVVKLWDYLQVNGNMDVTGNVGIGTQNPEVKLDVNGEVVVNSPDNTNIFGLALKRTDEDNRIHTWKFWHMNKGYGKNSLQLWEYKTDSKGNSCGGNAADGAMCNPRVTVTEGGSVGIGTQNPGATLDVIGAIRAGNSDIYFTKTDHNHTGIGNTAGFAAIENAKDYDALMILGRAGTSKGRSVKLWDYLEVNGELWASRRTGGAIDYAEYFESKNGKEIKPGTSVALEGGKIRPAKKGDTPIGIISANPLIAGGVPIEWPAKYLRDEFGSQIMEEYKEEIMAPKKEKIKKERQKMEKKKIKEKVTKTEIAVEDGKYFQEEITETIEREIEEPVFKEVDLYDAQKKKIIGKHRIPVMETYEEEIDVLDENGQPVMIGTGKFETRTRPKLNPKYDDKQAYESRERRPEWNCVGILGQLPLRKGQPTADSWIKIKDISKDVELWLVK